MTSERYVRAPMQQWNTFDTARHANQTYHGDRLHQARVSAGRMNLLFGSYRRRMFRINGDRYVWLSDQYQLIRDEAIPLEIIFY